MPETYNEAVDRQLADRRGIRWNGPFRNPKTTPFMRIIGTNRKNL
jgi:hypothetical protein